MSKFSLPIRSGCPPLSIVVAMTGDRVIGRRGKIPWDLPADRQLFRRLTIGNTVIMGRRTFDSLPAPLPDRHNLVVSRTLRAVPGATRCASLSEALAAGQRLGRPLFVIGGSALYREALPLADTLHVSWIDGDYAGDCYFPAFDPAAWQPVSSAACPGFRYVVYRRAG